MIQKDVDRKAMHEQFCDDAMIENEWPQAIKPSSSLPILTCYEYRTSNSTESNITLQGLGFMDGRLSDVWIDLDTQSVCMHFVP